MSKNNKHIVLITTGGTIAGVGTPGCDTGYTSGILSGKDLLSSLSDFQINPEIKIIELCNKNSDDITSSDWLRLVKLINKKGEESDTDAFIITHGTDTMEETAFFLSLTVKTDKPVILTGAMKPSTSSNPDGPKNLYDVINLVNSSDSLSSGVYVFMNGQIYTALEAEKKRTFGEDAFEPGLSISGPNNPWFGRFDCNSRFDVDNLETLPKVSIVYFYTDADVRLLEFAAENSDGIVIAGAGAGEFSLKWAEVIKDLSIPVIFSTRIGSGRVPDTIPYCFNAISAGDLSPQKAAILLRLCLGELKNAP